MSDHNHHSNEAQEVLPTTEFGVREIVLNDGNARGKGRGKVGRKNHAVNHSAHNHHHDHTESILRLKTAEGHLRGIQRMLEQDVYCIDILRQIQAVQAALSKISVSILNQHLKTCVITAVRGEDAQERERVLKEIAEVFETKQKI